jgi:SAM-dependent methyltransferase
MTPSDMPSYSSSQMDNFYSTLGTGLVKASGVMNYIQHLAIAERCSPGVSVLDLCCGRALMLPLLRRYAPHIARYIAIDISLANLREAQQLDLRDAVSPSAGFATRFVQGDVTALSSMIRLRFDVIIYTSAVEHMDRSAGRKSVMEASRVLTDCGRLFLSTPITEATDPKRLQYKVHVYEWSRDELEEVFREADLVVEERMGLLVRDYAGMAQAVEERFGASAAQWVREMERLVPRSFLEPIMAACFPSNAREMLYVCRRR